MRETKFRGKRKDGGGWVDGDLIHYEKNDYRILEQFDGAWDILEAAFEVIPESVGQLITKIKNVEYYEGDVIGCNDYMKETERIRGVLQYSESSQAFIVFDDDEDLLMNDLFYIRLLGNIHDNPELKEERL